MDLRMEGFIVIMGIAVVAFFVIGLFITASVGGSQAADTNAIAVVVGVPIAVLAVAATHITNSWPGAFPLTRYSESDSAALRELHTSTQGEAWLNKWRSSHWRGYGVANAKDGVFGEKRVTGLYLSNNNLVGRIPNSLTRLDKLEALYLEGNHLRGCIPAALFRVPDNDLAQIDLPICDAPLAPARIASGPPSGPRPLSPQSDPCPPGEPCVALHGDKTETAVGEPVTLTFAAVNAITLPELTAQMVIPIPSGWVAKSTEWTDACTALCNLAMKIPKGENRTTRVEIYPNESGDFSLRATLIWFAGEGAEANAKKRDEIINVRVN